MGGSGGGAQAAIPHPPPPPGNGKPWPAMGDVWVYRRLLELHTPLTFAVVAYGLCQHRCGLSSACPVSMLQLVSPSFPQRLEIEKLTKELDRQKVTNMMTDNNKLEKQLEKVYGVRRQ